MIARRIMKKDLSRGWTAWHEKWEEEARMKRMLRHAASKLHNPELSAAYAIWKEMWAELKQANAATPTGADGVGSDNMMTYISG